MKYKSVREFCLQKWMGATGRQRDGLVETFNNSFECQWQRRAESEGFGHIGLFCGSGKFNHNITDILTDERFDQLSFSNEEDKSIIFRQYCKLGLIISESLTDFQDIMKLCGSLTTKQSRSAISKQSYTEAVDKMISYCNCIFKHKFRGLYKCDHHTTLCFEDAGRDCCMGNILDLQCHSRDKCDEEINTIVVPKMDEMIERVIQAYDKLDSFFESQPHAFEKICKKYSEIKQLI